MDYKNYNVGSNTTTKGLSGSLYRHYLDYMEAREEDRREICLKIVGAGALNQCIKSVIIANKNLAGIGKQLIVKPYFENIDPKTNFTGVRLILALENI